MSERRKLSLAADEPLDRRTMLLTCGAVGAVAACGPSGMMNPDGGADGGTDGGNNSSGADVGAVTDFAEGTWTAVSRPPVIVARDAMGVFAYSSICTHTGCVVPAPRMNISECPCHSSRFDGEGRLLSPPATTPLPNYAVTIAGGRVFVDTSRTVPIGTRAPVT